MLLSATGGSRSTSYDAQSASASAARAYISSRSCAAHSRHIGWSTCARRADNRDKHAGQAPIQAFDSIARQSAHRAQNAALSSTKHEL